MKARNSGAPILVLYRFKIHRFQTNLVILTLFFFSGLVSIQATAFNICLESLDNGVRKIPMGKPGQRDPVKRPLNPGPTILLLKAVSAELPFAPASSFAARIVETQRKFSPDFAAKLKDAAEAGYDLLKRYKSGNYLDEPAMDALGMPIWEFIPLYYDIVSAYWEYLGVAHKVHTILMGKRPSLVIEVLPDRYGNILNQRAYLLKKEIGARIWLEHYTWNRHVAAFSVSSMAVDLPIEMTINPSGSFDVLIHEGWGHGKTQMDAIAGKVNAYYGGMEAASGRELPYSKIQLSPEKVVESGPYSRMFQFDEMYAFQIQLEHLLSEYELAPPSMKHELMEKIVGYGSYGYLVSLKTSRLLGDFITEGFSSENIPEPRKGDWDMGNIHPKWQVLELVSNSLDLKIHTFVPNGSNSKANFLKQLALTKKNADRLEAWFLKQIRVFYPKARLASEGRR